MTPKDQQMAELRALAEKLCSDKCDPTSDLVWGEGKPEAALVIVGEAPGAKENELGRPFVGPSGVFLDSELDLAGISRADAYVTSTVKCRYVKPGTSANRTPTVDEIDAWRDILVKEIEIVSPKLILCLGAVAASVLVHPGFSMSIDRGKWFSGPRDVPTMATYHPAYVLRFGRTDGSDRLRKFRADLLSIAEAISEVQHSETT